VSGHTCGLPRVGDYITETELTELCDRYKEVEKMLTGLIRYLEKENRRHRG
jgi:hypothetical protein